MSGVSISTVSLHHPPSHVPLHVVDTPIGAIRWRSIRLGRVASPATCRQRDCNGSEQLRDPSFHPQHSSDDPCFILAHRWRTEARRGGAKASAPRARASRMTTWMSGGLSRVDGVLLAMERTQTRLLESITIPDSPAHNVNNC